MKLSPMPWFSLAILQLLLLILVPCRLCAARNDPGGRHAGMDLPPWKLSLLVALPVATVALLASLIVFACRLRNRDAPMAVAAQAPVAKPPAAVAAKAPAAQAPAAQAPVAQPPAAQAQNREKVYKPNQYQWSTRLWSSTSTRNPMSINPTMVPSPNNYDWAAFSVSPPTVSSSAPREPASSSRNIGVPKFGDWSLPSSSSPSFSASPPTAPPGPAPAASADRATSRRGHGQSPLRYVPPARVQANRQQQTVIKDPLACYSPACSVLLTELQYDLLESGTNGFKRKSLPGGRVGPWNVVLKDTQFVEDEGLPAEVIIKRHHITFTEVECKRIREELRGKCTLRHKNLVKLHGK